MNDILELLTLMKKKPDDVNFLIDLAVAALKPVLYRAGSELLDVYKDYVANDELYKLRAQHCYKTFQAYMEAGFTEEQAMSLLLTTIHQSAIQTKKTVEGTINGIAKELND